MKFGVGFIIVAVSVIGGYMGVGGKLGVLWQPYEIVIIVGSAVGAFVISNPRSVIMSTGSTLLGNIKGEALTKDEYLELLSLLFTIFREGKSKGVMSLENDIEHPYESAMFQKYPKVLEKKRAVAFICDYLRLISLGAEDPKELESLMDEEIATIQKDLSRPVAALNAVGEALPAFGIVAAVLGIIKAMAYVNQATEILGKMIGGALCGTFLGVLLSYSIVMPLAGLMAARRDEMVNYYACIKSGLVAFLHGYPPQIAIEYSRKVLLDDVQPSFDAVEKATSEAIRSAAAEAI
ncbi:flagellar motor stator protein MotA [Parvularcula lutaonensis]|uniref:Flagellar motor stator protein MotA n=1 Tax=Parvularcula lutaonensis TaxID=491923 RepID=A0ABV7MED6_9PROT|nr:flagellar motor stator protein MotA [Parvularcula lutaonensis]GGY50699.1 chemotaxis protein MotA [Parvularcula lutaonensis]